MATVNRLNNILDRMADLEHQSIEKEFIGMLYGPPGAGKTTLAMWLAQSIKGEGDILMLDSGDGWVSLENTPSLMEGVTRIPVSESQDLPVVAQELSKRSKAFKNFTVVVIDELSSIAQDVLENVVRNATGTAKDKELPEIEGKHYGPMTQIVGSILRSFHKIPNLHVIIVAHDRDKTIRIDTVLVHPQFTPLLLKDIQKLVHVTGYVTAKITPKGDYIREVQAQPTLLVQAKSRIGGMPVKADFEEFVTIIANWVSSEGMVEDLNAPEDQAVYEDEPILPVGDPDVDSDDEPVIPEDV